MKIFKWNDANIIWNNNPYTWVEVQLIIELIAGDEDWDQWEKKKKQRLVNLILKINGNTITESKRREIKQYKIKAKDIKIAIKEVLNTEIIAENVSI